MTPAHYGLIFGCVMFIASIAYAIWRKKPQRDEYEPIENVESDNG